MLACIAGIGWECRRRRGTCAARQGRRDKGEENSEGRKRREKEREPPILEYSSTKLGNPNAMKGKILVREGKGMGQKGMIEEKLSISQDGRLLRKRV